MTRCDADLVIVTIEPCAAGSVLTPHARHRNFPEIRSEGETPREAARNLLLKLTGALDAKGEEDWHRIEMQQAVEDVRAYLEQARPPSGFKSQS